MAPAHDDGFHEIQLNGKQLVFLFMAATVVSVVIFLCGVLVGRGVRVERALQADASPVSAADETAPPPQPAQVPAPTPTGSDPRAAAPPPPVDELSYFNRLETKTPPREQLKAGGDKAPAGKTAAVEKPVVPEKLPAPEKPRAPEKVVAVAPAPTPAPAPPFAPKEVPKNVRPAAPTPLPPPAAAAEPAPAEPAGGGFAVQIAALNVRDEAEAIAKRLSSKGYAAYVITPTDGPAVYRVRVGKFPTRREAESIAAKLRKEEQFNPWVTR